MSSMNRSSGGAGTRPTYSMDPVSPTTVRPAPGDLHSRQASTITGGIRRRRGARLPSDNRTSQGTVMTVAGTTARTGGTTSSHAADARRDRQRVILTDACRSWVAVHEYRLVEQPSGA